MKILIYIMFKNYELLSQITTTATLKMGSYIVPSLRVRAFLRDGRKKNTHPDQI